MPRVKRHDDRRALDGSAEQRQTTAREPMAASLALREQHRARELEVATARELQQLQDTLRQTRGFAAEQAMADARQRVEAMRREVLTGADTATMRQMLADVFNQRADVARHEMEAHVEREKFASRLGLFVQRQALAQDDAIRAVTPLGFQANVQTAFDEIDAQGGRATTGPGGHAGAEEPCAERHSLQAVRTIACPGPASGEGISGAEHS